MTLIRHYVWFVMNYGCEWSGHRLVCYNTSPRWVQSIWYWACDWDWDEK